MSDHKKPTHRDESLPPSGEAQFPAIDPRMLAAMYGMQQEDEIDLLEYWRVIWKKKWWIVGLSLFAGLMAAGYSLTLPNIYRAEVLLAPVSAEGGKGGGLSSALGGLGGLASLAGVSMPSSGNVEENLAVLKSREFLWKFIKDEKLMPVLFEEKWNREKKTWLESELEKQPSLWAAYRMFTGGVLFVSIDKKSGLVTVGIEWTDAVLAAEWANGLVISLNEHLRQKAIGQSQSKLKYLSKELEHTRVNDQRRALFELVSQEQKKAMLANTQKQFVFQVIDVAVAPDKKSKPKRFLIVILSLFVVGFLTVIVVLIRTGVLNRALKEAE